MHVITGMKSLVEHDLIMRASIYTIRVQRVKIIHTNSIANVKLMLNNVAYVTSPKSHKYWWFPGTVCESATPSTPSKNFWKRGTRASHKRSKFERWNLIQLELPKLTVYLAWVINNRPMVQKHSDYGSLSHLARIHQRSITLVILRRHTSWWRE